MTDVLCWLGDVFLFLGGWGVDKAKEASLNLHNNSNGYISFKGTVIMSCHCSFFQENVHYLLNDASDVWKCNQQFAQFWNSLPQPFHILLFSYLFFTLFLWASFCKLFIRCCYFFLFFLWYFQLLFFFSVRLRLLLPFFLLILFLLLSFIIPCNPGNSLHFTFPDTCVCVCVCVCVYARGAGCCSLLLGAMCDDALLLNKSVLTVLCCQPCLWRVFRKKWNKFRCGSSTFKTVLQ